jgi:hypothetical protein
MVSIDEQFVHSVSHQLHNFKRNRNDLWSFRCPFCGDSAVKYKAHGYLYRYKDGLRYKCHKCGVGLSFGYFLKDLDPGIYKQYVYELFLERDGPKRPRIQEPPKNALHKPVPVSSALAGCPTIASLKADHPARLYLEARKIPEQLLEELYWTDDFWSVADRMRPDKNYPTAKLEGRIVIPFLNVNNELIAFQGRSLETTQFKYITIKAYEDAPRIFGMHRLPKTWERLYAVEGPFDSLFLSPSVALAGGDIPTGFPSAKTVIVYDNEPRKRETCDKINKAIDRGYRVCIWPGWVQEKDINLMILKGYTPEHIRTIIDENSFDGLMATFRLGMWRRDK